MDALIGLPVLPVVLSVDLVVCLAVRPALAKGLEGTRRFGAEQKTGAPREDDGVRKPLRGYRAGSLIRRRTRLLDICK
ncbi:hypothetical protein Ocepr_0517 [Oceanithermus profundus DSM 14977]|uniref:Uncharacterized protein n=1 Tax=Oceanithermus profundus (strain DSM 14977 / NBRC 100410 / VKM B-2274 / 506) TaxID=670487 RepID=E4U6X2_OCEP5|nr:hypothetical protein [Oceanithermus profundus]ADR35975.1 hypothetical protein Ocepr_0517 [Oceanithermus profundus DSM 14977]